MSRFAKTILLAEVAVCFGPITLMLLAGLSTIWALGPGASGALFIGMMAMGVAGLVAIFCVVRWLLIRPLFTSNATIVLLLMCLGCVPVFMFALRRQGTLDQLVFTLPLLCTAHLAYLARDYLFASFSRSEH
jgi:hypothetical protein